MKLTGPWDAVQRIAALHAADGGFDELARLMLREVMTLVGALQGQLLLADDLRTIAEMPAGIGERFSFGMALDALADRQAQWDTALEDETAWCVPLVVHEGVLALMMLGWNASKVQVEPRTRGLEAVLGVMALTLCERRLRGELIERDSRLDELGHRYDDAVQRAATDGLTGLVNQAHFKEVLNLEIGRSKRYSNALTLLMVDIDLFKGINDSYGHLTGDVVIRRIAQALKGQVRDCDIAARYGGEEFAILLPQTDTTGAMVVAERIRQRVRDMVFTTMDKLPIPPVTVSLGIGQLRMTDTALTFVERTDKNLYEAKRTGRNRVVSENSSSGEEARPGLQAQRQQLATTHRAAFLGAIAEAATEEVLRDTCRTDHAGALTAMLRHFAARAGLSENQILDVLMAAGMHHVGKVVLPGASMAKAEALDPQEWELVQAHPQLAQPLIAQIAGMGTVAEALLYHHECWDGTGVPYGLAGEQIPLASRVLAIIDDFLSGLDAAGGLEALTDPAAQASIEAAGGRKYDPKLVPVFLELLRQPSDPAQ